MLNFLKNKKIEVSPLIKEKLTSSLAILPNKVWSQLGENIYGIVSNQDPGDKFGGSVSINSLGNRIAIGARYANSNNSGSCRLYELSGNSWIQLGQDIHGSNAPSDVSAESGRSVSINGDGTRVAIGEPYWSNKDGRCRVYELNGNNWIQIGDIRGLSYSDSNTNDDAAGECVSLNFKGDRVAVGSPWNDDLGASRGHCRVFEYNANNGQWAQLGDSLYIGSSGRYVGGGTFMSLNDIGNRIIFSSPWHPNTGICKIFEYNDTSWVQLGQDLYGESAGDSLGICVSINSIGDIVGIGASGNVGRCKIYKYISGSWNQLGVDIIGKVSGDGFGKSVSINSIGDRIAISSTSNLGYCRIYKYNGSEWNKLDQDINGEAVNHEFGSSISINGKGNHVVIGAPNNDGYCSIFNYDWL